MSNSNEAKQHLLDGIVGYRLVEDFILSGSEESIKRLDNFLVDQGYAAFVDIALFAQTALQMISHLIGHDVDTIVTTIGQQAILYEGDL